jgi:hypothetical protein
LKAPRTAVCPVCGHKVEQHAKPVIVVAGTLKEMKPEDIKQKEMPAAKKFPNKHKTYGELMWYQQRHGKKDKWAMANYKTLYGVWPRESVMGQWRKYFEAPDMELASWLQSRRIAWVRRGNRWSDDNIQNDRPQHVNGNGHMNGNGHDNGALTDREQAIIDRVADQAKVSLMTAEDWRDMDDFK